LPDDLSDTKLDPKLKLCVHVYLLLSVSFIPCSGYSLSLQYSFALVRSSLAQCVCYSRTVIGYPWVQSLARLNKLCQDYMY